MESRTIMIAVAPTNATLGDAFAQPSMSGSFPPIADTSAVSAFDPLQTLARQSPRPMLRTWRRMG